MIKYNHLLLLGFAMIHGVANAEDALPNTQHDANTSHHEIVLPLTANSVAELARKKTGGKVLSVKEETLADRLIFHVKVLHNNGKVKIYRVDSNTGHFE